MRLFGHDDSANIGETSNKSDFSYRSRVRGGQKTRVIFQQKVTSHPVEN